MRAFFNKLGDGATAALQTVKSWPRVALLVGLVLAGVLSLVGDAMDDTTIHIAKLIAVNVVLAVSLNLVNGHTGQFSLGHAGFMSVGAFVSARITLEARPWLIAQFGDHVGWMGSFVIFPIALVAGGLVAAFAGLIVGVPSLRLKGDYLAIVTLGFGEIIRVLLQITLPQGPIAPHQGFGDFVGGVGKHALELGGALGLSGIPEYTTLFWGLAVAAITIYVIGALVSSTYGRGFLSVRDDEIAAEAMGINTTKYKVVAFVLSSFFAGLAGGLFAHLNNNISANIFNLQRSVDVVIMVILGGMGNTAGVAIAAVGLTILSELLRDAGQYRMVVFAAMLVVLMILRPQGLLGDLGRRRHQSKA
jgi:branched-chain amino acid transport system permease protein